MFYHIKPLPLLLALVSFCYTPQSAAVFCCAHDFVNPETGNHIWLFGDVHCDIDPAGTITRLQQHQLLEAAKNRNALIIAENVSVAGYNPYKWMGLLAMDTLALYIVIKQKKYMAIPSLGLFGFATGKLWHNEWLFTQKPTITSDEHLKTIKRQYSPSTCLTCFGHTPLKRLVEEATQRGIPAIDLEFRYHMIGAYREFQKSQIPSFHPQKADIHVAHAFHWIASKATGNKARYPLTVQDYCHVNDAILQEINASHDIPAVLQSFCERNIGIYQASYITKELREIAQTNPACSLATIVPHLAHKFDKDFMTALQNFSEHNKELFDARLAHEIYRQRATKTMFVCTGADHTLRFRTLLEELGYQEVYSHGKDNVKKLEEAGALNKNVVQVKDLDNLVIDLQQVFTHA